MTQCDKGSVQIITYLLDCKKKKDNEIQSEEHYLQLIKWD